MAFFSKHGLRIVEVGVNPLLSHAAVETRGTLLPAEAMQTYHEH
jgi:hypothetical protein